jgi:gastric triacylglycerol lipase
MLNILGYPEEDHWVETEDGFVLSMQRIPFGKNNKFNGNRPVVLLQHGLLDSACTWVCLICWFLGYEFYFYYR